MAEINKQAGDSLNWLVELSSCCIGEGGKYQERVIHTLASNPNQFIGSKRRKKEMNKGKRGRKKQAR